MLKEIHYNFQTNVGWNPASAIFTEKAAEILMLSFLMYKENNLKKEKEKHLLCCFVLFCFYLFLFCFNDNKWLVPTWHSVNVDGWWKCGPKLDKTLEALTVTLNLLL